MGSFWEEALMEGNLNDEEEGYLYLGACHLAWNSPETQADHRVGGGGGGGVAYARQGDLET